MWNIRNIKVIPVVVGALGSISKKLKKWIEELGVVISAALQQKTALLIPKTDQVRKNVEV